MLLDLTSLLTSTRAQYVHSSESVYSYAGVIGSDSRLAGVSFCYAVKRTFAEWSGRC